MGIFAHEIITSSGKKLTRDELASLVRDLLQEQICSLPGAILVGDAQETPWYGATGEE